MPFQITSHTKLLTRHECLFIVELSVGVGVHIMLNLSGMIVLAGVGCALTIACQFILCVFVRFKAIGNFYLFICFCSAFKSNHER